MGNSQFWGAGEPVSVEQCDSTWDSDSQPEEEQRPAQQTAPAAQEATGDGGAEEQNKDKADSSVKPKRSFFAARDLYMYRHGYPAKSRENSSYANLKFYMNEIPLKPDGVYIDDIITKWKGDYDNLENNHTYIQWLFPLREPGLNWHAEELTTEEIKGKQTQPIQSLLERHHPGEPPLHSLQCHPLHYILPTVWSPELRRIIQEFLKTKKAKYNYLQVYEIMLDFFGMKLEDKNTGTVCRASNWKERFQHLNESQHNYLRITRILKSLGEFKFESFQIHLVHFLLSEALVEETLSNMLHSALEYFIYTIKSRKERRKLLRFARQHYRPPENFVWGPLGKEGSGEKSIINKLSTPSEKRLSAQDKSRSESMNDRSRTHVAFAAVASSSDISPGTAMHQTEQVTDQGKTKAESVAAKNKTCVKEKSNHQVTKLKVPAEPNIDNQAPQSQTENVEDTDSTDK